MAQSYPGLSAGSGTRDGQVREAPSSGGYGGLTGTATRKAPVRMRIGSDEAAEPDEEQQETERAEQQQNDIRQTEQMDVQRTIDLKPVAQIPPVQTKTDLQMAAVISENAKNRPSVLPGPRLNERTLAVLNRPQEKINGMWPEESRTVSYIQAVFNDIQNSPPNQRRDKINAVKNQIRTMMNANETKLAIPDDVSVKMGIAPQAVAERKAAATAVNVRLGQALSKLN